MQLDGVHHIGMNVQDLDSAEKFYTDVLGFRVAERFAEEIRHLMLDTGSTTLHLFESPALICRTPLLASVSKVMPTSLLVQAEKNSLRSSTN